MLTNTKKKKEGKENHRMFFMSFPKAYHADNLSLPYLHFATAGL